MVKGYKKAKKGLKKIKEILNEHEEGSKRMDIEDNQINWEEEEDKVHEIAKEYATPKTKFDLSEKKHWTEVGKEKFNLHPSRIGLRKPLNKEFDLSEKIYDSGYAENIIDSKHVKEFIKREREIITNHNMPLWRKLEELDKLAGELLI